MLKSLTRRNIFVSFNTKTRKCLSKQKKKDCFKDRVNLLYNLEEDVVSISNYDSEAYSIINNYEILN